MPVYANTPEARIVGRTDSKNPSTTCRGITSSGRPCRRPITASDDPSPPQSSRLKASKPRADDPTDESMYCWQHKDQAGASPSSTPSPRPTFTPIPEERTSIDTLAERLGLARTESARPEKPHFGSPRPPSHAARPKPKKETLFCCCFRIPIDDIDPQPRPRPHSVQPTSASTPAGLGIKKKPARRSSGSSLIPQTTAPDVASKLLAELAKPVSQQDEAGYIYIFWLTPESKKGASAPAETARSLLAPPSTPPGHGRRTSDVLASFARLQLGGGDDDDDNDSNDITSRGIPTKPKTNKKTILLKIGRATNVQRRLNEWQRQCGYDLSLVRYYPYVPSSDDTATAEEVARKVPHSHKVERLVHIELAGRGMRVADREKCEACGREHREWFEVEASRAAVKEVDEVVRRWADWDEGV
ncbi:meiotically up-regulated gene 113-domain-containing protein [Staphylotrichum tortipilum]|uniref:Meiotically up-regulated gene 113-domain-containing protein n=1 Tax=Staphylotrichum tortipilum TaxID=2831512 RepID=A0AAN6MU92_9PEZI|nr:meiotically up-regulated gene 113-domain-containing protein [Staphylotrichum longicolle]